MEDHGIQTRMLFAGNLTNPKLNIACSLFSNTKSQLSTHVFDEIQPEIVIHMAAQPIVRESYKNPVYTYEVNVMGTVNILECVRTHRCVRSFVNVTTSSGPTL